MKGLIYRGADRPTEPGDSGAPRGRPRWEALTTPGAFMKGQQEETATGVWGQLEPQDKTGTVVVMGQWRVPSTAYSYPTHTSSWLNLVGSQM